MAAIHNHAVHQIREHITIMMERARLEHEALKSELRMVNLLLGQLDASVVCPMEDECPITHPRPVPK